MPEAMDDSPALLVDGHGREVRYLRISVTDRCNLCCRYCRDEDIPEQIEKLKALMRVASASLDFETAIKLRDEIAELKKMQTKITKAKRGKP